MEARSACVATDGWRDGAIQHVHVEVRAKKDRTASVLNLMVPERDARKEANNLRAGAKRQPGSCCGWIQTMMCHSRVIGRETRVVGFKSICEQHRRFHR